MGVLWLGLLAVASAGVGAWSLGLFGGLLRRWQCGAQMLAAGLMLLASLHLAIEGLEIAPAMLLAGLAVGLLAMPLGAWFTTERAQAATAADCTGRCRTCVRRMVVVLVAFAMHSASEGVALGVAYAGGGALGVTVVGALVAHKLPEGLVIAMVLAPRGISPRMAAGWAMLCSLPQALLAVPAFLLVSVFTPLLPVGLGFAAGAMTFVALTEVLPGAFGAMEPDAVPESQ